MIRCRRVAAQIQGHRVSTQFSQAENGANPFAFESGASRSIASILCNFRPRATFGSPPATFWAEVRETIVSAAWGILNESNYRIAASQPTVRLQSPGHARLSPSRLPACPNRWHAVPDTLEIGTGNRGDSMTQTLFEPQIGRPGRVIRLITTLAQAAIVLSVTTVSADDFSPRNPLFARLATPMKSIQNGKPFREALESIAGQVELNLWLDRRVDPTAPVTAGPVTPTVSAAIEKIAAERGCVMMAVRNVVLVGRPAWVDATAATLLSIDDAENRPHTSTVSWEALSTPQEAISAASRATSSEVSPPLPHDLWPAVQWRQIDRRVAIALVLAQFDLRPQAMPSVGTIRCKPATAEGKFSRRYSAGKDNPSIRSAIENADRKAVIRAEAGWLQVTASASAHRAATTAMLASESKRVKPAADQDTDTFSLKPTRATAGDLLSSFAKTAGRKCLIDPAAAKACSQMVTIEADNQTLRQLIDRVAEEAGVSANWRQDDIVIRPAK